MATALKQEFLTVAGVERRYLLGGHREGTFARPVVIEFHGSGHFPEHQIAASGMAQIGIREGFLVVAPEALLPIRVKPDWPAGRAWRIPGVPLAGQNTVDDEGPDDVAFVSAIIDRLLASGIADPQRVYAMGFSGGARLCSHLAGRMPNRLAAISAVAGLRLAPLSDAVPPPIVAFHGLSDPMNPYGGGLGPRWDLGMEATMQAFAQRYDWWERGKVAAAGADKHVFIDSESAERLVFYSIHGGLHNWPGSTDPGHISRYGPANYRINASELSWDFFKSRVVAASSAR